MQAPATSTPSHLVCFGSTANSDIAVDCGSAAGGSAGKGLGTSVNDPGTGNLEYILPLQLVTGASHTFVTADLFKKTRRSNSGSAMTDTFPAAGTTGLTNGTVMHVTNSDASATDTIAAGAGTTIASGSSYAIPYGRDVMFTYDAANTDWKLANNTGSAIIGPSSATANDVAIFADTTGKRAADGGKTLPSGAIVGTSDTQTLTGKSIAGSEINSGTIPPAQMPLPTTSTLGAVESISCPSHQWIDVVPTTQTQPSCAQPAASDLAAIGSGDVVANSTGSSAAPADTTVTALLDRALGSTQGQMIYRGASSWSVLAPANAYQALCTLGASQNPFWCNATVIVAQSGAAVSAGADTTEDTLATITIPANAMGANGCLDIDTIWTITNGANTKTLRIRFSGGSGSAYLNVAPTTSAGGTWRTKICNANATNSQIGGMAGASFGNGAGTAALITGSADTTASQTVVITGLKASSGDTLMLDQYTVKLTPSP
ncbi:MAG TPA: hypothetical protein VGG48_01925 [Rhizomicrobium sp.]